jgi:hypothetical protein
MRRRSLVLAATLTVSAVAGLTTWTQARQQAPAPSPDRAQDQRPPDGSPFSTLPGFRVERVTPADKTDSYIVVTFDSLGRPVVGQSASGSGSHPRTLIDANNDGIFEGEKVISEQLNTCHGLFFEGRTLYANCFGPRDPALDGPAPTPPPPAGAAGAAPAATRQASPASTVSRISMVTTSTSGWSGSIATLPMAWATMARTRSAVLRTARSCT